MSAEEIIAELPKLNPEEFRLVREKVEALANAQRHSTEPAPTALPPAPSEAELKSSLLAAVGKTTRPYRNGEFVELTRRVIAEDRRA
jgi:hypothetical protein